MDKYKTVTIYDQVWMTENLYAETYRNGNSVPHADTNEKWIKYTQKKIGCWRYREEEISNARNGLQYNLYAIKNPGGLAPEGFRVPSREDWIKLFTNLGGVLSGHGWVEAHSAQEIVKKFESVGFNLTSADEQFSVFWLKDDKYKYPCLSAFFLDEKGLWSITESEGKELLYEGYSVRCMKDTVGTDD